MLDLIQQRNHDFYRQCIQEIEATPPGRPILLNEVTGRAARQSPPSYYMTYDYALRRVREHRRKSRRGPNAGRSERQWEELSERVAARERRHRISDREALARELAEGRPSSYFMSPSYAKRLYQRIKQK